MQDWRCPWIRNVMGKGRVSAMGSGAIALSLSIVAAPMAVGAIAPSELTAVSEATTSTDLLVAGKGKGRGNQNRGNSTRDRVLETLPKILSPSSSGDSNSTQPTSEPTPSGTVDSTTPATRGIQSLNLSNGVQISFLDVTYNDSGTSVWRYYVEKASPGNVLNHWSLGLPTCAQVVQVTANGQPASSDGIRGIQWSTPASFSGGEFAVTLNDKFAVGVTSVAASGNETVQGVLPGPNCRTLSSPAF